VVKNGKENRNHSYPDLPLDAARIRVIGYGYQRLSAQEWRTVDAKERWLSGSAADVHNHAG